VHFLGVLDLQDASLGEKGGKVERKREKERESFTEILSFLERFSPHVESQYIFYRALSLQTRENLSIFNLFLSLSLPSPVSLYLRCLADRGASQLSITNMSGTKEWRNIKVELTMISRSYNS
jgi:hypothetical protein